MWHIYDVAKKRPPQEGGPACVCTYIFIYIYIYITRPPQGGGQACVFTYTYTTKTCILGPAASIAGASELDPAKGVASVGGARLAGGSSARGLLDGRGYFGGTTTCLLTCLGGATILIGGGACASSAGLSASSAGSAIGAGGAASARVW